MIDPRRGTHNSGWCLTGKHERRQYPPCGCECHEEGT